MDLLADPFGEALRHAEIMTPAIYAQLALLALIDSTSIGTLLIPLWLLLRTDGRRLGPKVLFYLGVVASFYFIVGVLVLLGAGLLLANVGDGIQSLTELAGVQWGLVIVGGSLLGYALSDGKKSKSSKGEPSKREKNERRWQARIGKALSRPSGLVVLGLSAGLLELPTMLPYLAAIGVVANSSLPPACAVAVLLAYCVLMLVPALALLGARVALGVRAEPMLRRVNAKLGKYSAEALMWIVGIVGFLLLRTGLSNVAPYAAWNPFK